jgi:hypothetical protein
MERHTKEQRVIIVKNFVKNLLQNLTIWRLTTLVGVVPQR